MNAWEAVAIGLLSPFGMVLAVLALAWPVGRMFTLWFAVPATEREAFEVLPPRVKRSNPWFSYFIIALIFSGDRTFHWPWLGNEKLAAFLGTLKLAVGLCAILLTTLAPICCALRVLFRPAGEDGPEIRRFARFALPFFAAWALLGGSLVCSCLAFGLEHPAHH